MHRHCHITFRLLAPGGAGGAAPASAAAATPAAIGLARLTAGAILAAALLWTGQPCSAVAAAAPETTTADKPAASPGPASAIAPAQGPGAGGAAGPAGPASSPGQASGPAAASMPAPANPPGPGAAPAQVPAAGANSTPATPANGGLSQGPLSFPGPLPGIENDAGERSVKAAFLYRFLSYIDWPAQSFPHPDSPYVVGLVGNHALARELTEISSGRLTNGRTVAVRQIADGETLAGVHLLFISREDSLGQAAWLRRTQQAHVVSVTESEGALAQGSVINFLRADARMRFEISLAAAERCACRLSSRLLALAATVQAGPSR